MAIKVGGTTVIDDSRQLSNIASVDATTVAALGAAGVGGGGGSADFTATGTIASGDVVGLNSDGTVSVIEKDTLSATSLSTFTTVASPSSICTAYHVDAKKVVVVYKDGSTSYLMLAHGTVSGDTISFSSPVTLKSAAVGQISCFYEDIYKTVVIIYVESGETRSTSYAFDSGGTGIQGPEVRGNTGQNPFYVKTAWNKKEGRVFAIYEDFTQNNLELASWQYERRNSSNNLPNIYNDRICLLTNQNPTDPAVTYDESTDCVIVGYTDSADSSKGKIVAYRDSDGYGSNSHSTQDNRGTHALYPDGDTNTKDTEVIYDPSSKSTLVFFRAGTNNKVFACRVNSKTLNVEVGPTLNLSTTDNSYSHVLQVSPKTGEVLLNYRVGSVNKAYLLSVDPASLTVTSNSSATIYSSVVSNSTGSNIAYDPYTDKFILGLADSAGSNYGKTLFIKPELATKDTSTCIGVAAENISSGSTGEITVSGGINEVMTGLTAGKTYYLNYKGEVSLEPSDVELGKALSSTKMLLNVKELNSNVILREAGENIYNGQPVCLGNDSKVYPVINNTGTYTKSSISVSSGFYSMNTVYDPIADVHVMAYKNSSNGYGYFVNVTINADETLTFGTPVQFTTGSNTVDSIPTEMVYDPSTGYVVMAYWDNQVYNWRLVSYKPSTGTIGSTITMVEQGETSCNASLDISRDSNGYNVEDAAIYFATSYNSNSVYLAIYRVNSSGTLTRNSYNTTSVTTGALRSVNVRVSGSVVCIAGSDSQYYTRVFWMKESAGQIDTIYNSESYFQLEGESVDSSGNFQYVKGRLRSDHGVRLVAFDDASFVLGGHWQGSPFLVGVKFSNPDNMDIPPHKGIVKRINGDFSTAYSTMYLVNDSIYWASAAQNAGMFLSARVNPDNLDTLEITDVGFFPVLAYTTPFTLAHIPHKDKSIVIETTQDSKLAGRVFKPVRNHDFIGFAKENIDKGSSGKVLVEGGVVQGVSSIPANSKVKLLANGSLVPSNGKTTSGIGIGTSYSNNQLAINKVQV